MAEIASLLQVSDLHFYKKITFEGGHHWGRRNFLVKGHSHSKLYTFSRTVFTKRLAEGLEDLVVATGDISTDGAKDSLAIARSFFDLPWLYENGRLVTHGLAAPPHRRLIVPGNHDRYGDTFLPYESATNRDLEHVFGLKDEYPYVFGYKRPAHLADTKSPTLIFYVFDSTLTGTPAESRNPMRRIARGVATQQDCDWLESMPDTLRRQGYVPDAGGGQLNLDYDNTIRIVLLHHHPVRRQKRGLRQLLNSQNWSVMENAERFIEACFNAEVDLVLFGHEHQNYNEPQQRQIGAAGSERVHTIRFVCCPSTTEYSEDKNGYYFIDFNVNEYQMHHFQWKGTAYRKETTYRQDYNRPLSLSTGTAGGA